jgi:uncharacterized membrane protein
VKTGYSVTGYSVTGYSVTGYSGSGFPATDPAAISGFHCNDISLFVWD